jgi:hypothetical protein
VTHYASPIASWERDLDVLTPEGGSFAAWYAPPKPLEAGSRADDRWLGGPIGTAVSPLWSGQGWDWIPFRQGDSLNLALPSWIDAAGHIAGALSQDGTQIWQSDSPWFMWGDVPPERHTYRLDYTATRANGFWQRSTTVQTSWWFPSQRPEADHEVVPLMTARLDVPLSDAATAPAGAQSFPLELGMPDGATPAPATNVRVDVSVDGGASWQPARVRGCRFADGRGTTCQVRVVNPAGTSVSLRLSARDGAGRAIAQTIVDAYAVR